MMDGSHHTVHHHLHQDSQLLRSRLGSPMQIQMSRRGPGVFRSHVQVSLHEPVTSDPVFPDVICPSQQCCTTQRLPLPRSDIEILTTFNEDTSSIRDDYAAWVTADPTTFRARHMTDKGAAKPVFREARVRKCFSSPSEYKFDASKPNRLSAQTRTSILTWPLKDILHGSDTSLLYRKTLNICSTKSSQTVFSHLPPCWLRCLVQQGYLPPRRRGKVCLHSRH